MLINNDKYVAVGKEPKLLSTLASSLRLVDKESKGNDTLDLQKQTLRNIIEERYKKTASRDNRVQRMLADLDEVAPRPNLLKICPRMVFIEYKDIVSLQKFSNIKMGTRVEYMNILQRL